MPAVPAGLALLASVLSGCSGIFSSANSGQDEDKMAPLPVQQARAYPEAATGKFLSLADFEDSPFGRGKGSRQVDDFYIQPAKEGARRTFVLNVTRTGAGAMEVTLPAGAKLVYQIPEVHDFSPYTLLTLAVHSPAIRDDFRILIATDRAGWESQPVLLRPGWNYVTVDLQRIKKKPDFQARGVRSIRLWFDQAQEPVRFGLDDIMLVDNRRDIAPVPPGMRLTKDGLDYELTLPDRGTLRISQQDDGLWHLGGHQMGIELFGKDSATSIPTTSSATEPGAVTATSPAPREDIAVMGPRRVGEVEVLECNELRLRLANTWYFPSDAGQWATLSVRQIRWEYTFYADGRQVTDLIVNNAGGEDISGIRLTAPTGGIWSDGQATPARLIGKFLAGSGRWMYMSAPEHPTGRVELLNFAAPAKLQLDVGTVERTDGDAGGDGFDESQGCYRLRAKAGHCRFRLLPPPEGLASPVIRVAGKWNGPVCANLEGLAIRDLTRLADGSVIFVLPGILDRPSWVEVTGPVPLLDGD